MSSVSSVSSSSINATQQNHRPHRTGGMDKVMSEMADYLGVSTDELKSAQENGQTLDDLATAKGLSTDDLHAKLAESLEKNKPSDAPSDIDFAQMATEVASGKGPGGPGGGHGGPPPPRKDSDGGNTSTSSLSDLLEQYGIDSSDLSTLLSSATTSSSNSSSGSSDFASQLKSLISQYGTKGNLYDTTL